MHDAITGTWFVCPTPFCADGSLDPEGITTLVDAAVDWGVDGLTVLGVMGEAGALTDAERDTAQRTFVSAARGRVPVAVGCSAPSAAVVAERVRRAVDAGAAAAMVSAPPLLRDTDRIAGFFAEVGAAAAVPVIVQDEPAATGVVLPVSALAAAVDAAGSTVVKLEDPPTPPKITRLLRERPGLTVFGGLGGVSAYWELRRGGAGTMTGFAFPEILAAIRIHIEDNDIAAGAAVFDRYLPYIAYEGQPGAGLAVRKEVLRRRGALPGARARTVPTPDATVLDELDDVLARVGLEPSRSPLRVAA
ncbi:MAG TPA: dihydrodipicolinate synthase family protein [Nocardioidaceae bacterium]|nr:dihydrodipicolinate synthase family protein [Nocardioidaceae bacterium]